MAFFKSSETQEENIIRLTDSGDIAWSQAGPHRFSGKTNNGLDLTMTVSLDKKMTIAVQGWDGLATELVSGASLEGPLYKAIIQSVLKNSRVGWSLGASVDEYVATGFYGKLAVMDFSEKESVESSPLPRIRVVALPDYDKAKAESVREAIEQSIAKRTPTQLASTRESR